MSLVTRKEMVVVTRTEVYTGDEKRDDFHKDGSFAVQPSDAVACP
jgi:hypothetical protein